MMTSPISTPLIFEPVLKRILWGGRRLETLLGKRLGPEPDYAESWEIADHPNGQSVVAQPVSLAGKSLAELVHNFPNDLLGPAVAAKYNQFPLLIKFLDAHQVLSLQVHPDDSLARQLVNDNGKNEAWVILHAEPGSRIYAGLKPGVTRERFQSAIDHQTVPDLVHWFEPCPGDCIMIPAGTVHAIGAGIVLAEIQQMSDATFRVDDWGRVGADGKPRPLHLKETMLATDFNRGPVGPVVPVILPTNDSTCLHERLTTCPYFEIDRLQFKNKIRLGDRDKMQFTIMIVLKGKIQISPFEAAKGAGTTVLLPASLGEIEVRQIGDESSTILACRVPLLQ
jgi:mannose-6-phosphate isomerase